VLPGDLFEGLPGAVGVVLYLHPVAADLQQGLPDGVGSREAVDHDVEVVEGLLELALVTVRSPVLEEPSSLLLRSSLRTHGRGDHGSHGEDHEKRA
jgi:hypothetical protein